MTGRLGLGVGIGIAPVGASGSFSPPPPAAYRVIVSDYTPDEFATIVVLARLIDAFGRIVTGAGHVVTWSKTGVGGSFSAPTSVTDAFGRATVNFTVASDVYTITATDDSALTGTSDEIDVIISDPVAGYDGTVHVVDHYLATVL